MVSNAERYGWAIVFGVLIAFAVPWFMWGASEVAFGLPLWLWWHVAWMALATGVFWLFATRAWGLGIVDDAETGSRGGELP